MKSVGFTSTCAPLDSVQSVTPTAGVVFVATILPGAGSLVTSAAPDRFSVYATTGVFPARSNTAFNSAGVGTFTLSFAGDSAMITRFSSVIHSLAILFTSVSVIVGTSCWTSLYSYSTPGNGSPFR